MIITVVISVMKDWRIPFYITWLFDLLILLNLSWIPVIFSLSGLEGSCCIAAGLRSVCQHVKYLNGSKRTLHQLWLRGASLSSSQETNVLFEADGESFPWWLLVNWWSIMLLPVLVLSLCLGLFRSTTFWIGPDYPRVYSDRVWLS